MHVFRSQTQVGLLGIGRQVVTAPSQWTEPRSEISSSVGAGTWPISGESLPEGGEMGSFKEHTDLG